MIKRQDLPVLGIALLATFLPLILIQYKVLQFTGGIFMYPIDDTFIHMQVSRMVATQGNWGITTTEFGSASSSILYTVLLSVLFKIFSPNLFIPFIVNCIAAIALLYVVQQRLKRYGLSAKAQIILLLLLIFLTPLPMLIMSGMEHTLQCLFVFLFVFGIAEWLEESANTPKALPWQIYIYGMMVTGFRYEGMLMIGVVCLVLLFSRKILTAFMLGFASLVPLLIFGIYSLAKGSYFIPNSVLVKSEPIVLSIKGIAGFIGDTLIYKLTSSRAATAPPFAKPGITLLATQRLLIILPLCYLLFQSRFGKRSMTGYALIIFSACTVLHLTFAATGWFYRYEAYLMMGAVLSVGICFAKWGKELFQQKPVLNFLGLLLAFALAFPLVLRISAAFSKAHQASINIYEQQYQMGQFLKTYYDRDTIAANDVGAISYLTQARVVDLWGLGNIDVAKSRKKNYWTPAFLDSLCRQNHVKIAMVYDSWFSPELLSRWKKLAVWEIPNNVICGDDKVSFYAVDPAAEVQLRRNLLEFQPRLPADVKVSYP